MSSADVSEEFSDGSWDGTRRSSRKRGARRTRRRRRGGRGNGSEDGGSGSADRLGMGNDHKDFQWKGGDEAIASKFITEVFAFKVRLSMLVFFFFFLNLVSN